MRRSRGIGLAISAVVHRSYRRCRSVGPLPWRENSRTASRTAKPVAHHTGVRGVHAILRAAEGTQTMDQVRNLAGKFLALVTSAFEFLRRSESQARVQTSDGDLLERARRAADGGRLKEAWALYRQLPAGLALLPELYDLACALATHGGPDEAAD